jgi:hypothetical protein
MAVIKISDDKSGLPPIIKISIGNKSTMIKINSKSVIQNSNSSLCK